MARDMGRSLVCPVLIGRDREVAVLRRAVDAAAGGGFRAVLIAGDAGLGKSRLLAAARDYAGERDFLVVQGACFPRDLTEPYAPLADALRARFAGLPPTAVAAACGPYVQDLRPLLPDLFPPTEAAPSVAAAGQEPRRLFAALSHCLVAHAGPRPVLLAVEDLHWCDEASLDALFALARWAKDRPLLLLGTYRDDEATQHLRAWVRQMERAAACEPLPLAPLTPEEVGAMIGAIVGAHAGLPAHVPAAVAGLAEGNPLYVEELLTALTVEGAPSPGDDPESSGATAALPLPPSLQAAVQQRVERLSPAARQVLQLASVIGRRFDVGLLQQLAERDEEAFVPLLEEFVAAGLVVEESADRFVFRHALTQQAVCAGLLSRTRILLHRRVAEAAEALYAETLDQHLGDLGEHFLRAKVWDKAQAYARRAGARALRFSALRAAVEHYSRALEANRQLTAAAGTEQPDALLLAEAAAAAHLGRGRAAALLGDFEQARADYDAAVTHARAAGDRREECRGLLAAGVLWATRDHPRAGAFFREAVALARRVEDPELLADCLNRLGNWHVYNLEPWEAMPLHEEALTLAERLGRAVGVATTLDWLGTAHYLGADLAGSVPYFERAAQRFRELDDRPLLASCLAMLTVRGGSYVMLSPRAGAADVEAGLRDGEEALAIARAIDAPAAEAFALIQLAAVLGPRGEYGRALGLAERALRLAETIGHGQWATAARCTIGRLLLDLGAPEDAREHVERALEEARTLCSNFWTLQASALLVLVDLRLHEAGRAAATIGGCPVVAGPVRSLGHWWQTYARARLALARRDPASALRLCDRLRAGSAGDAAEETPLLMRLRVEALTALAARGEAPRGWAGEAERSLVAAREAMRRQGARSELWRVHAALGTLYRALDRNDDARREFAAARTVIEAIAEDLTDASLRDRFLRSATASLPRAFRLSPLSREAARHGGLSAREREVAVLIARGKTNAEIAEALVLGRRTVETHVANILAKLGVDSRREIAAWVTSRGLAAESPTRAA